MSAPRSMVDRRASVIGLASIVVLSLVAQWICVASYGYHLFFVTADRFRWHADLGAVLWRGEIVFGEQRINLQTGPGGPCQYMALNLQTGIVRPAGFELQSGGSSLVTDGDRLWAVSPREVVETDGQSVKRYRPQFALNSASIAFLLNQQLTTIAIDRDGKTRLYTLVDGEWQAGRQIALPGIGRTWAFDVERSCERLVPSTTGKSPTTGGWVFTRVQQIGDEVHLLSTSYAIGIPAATAYRVGFDFVPDADDVPSALAPANSEPDTTGWFLLDPSHFNGWVIPAQIQGKLVLARPTSDPCFWKPIPSKPGQFEILDMDSGRPYGVQDQNISVTSSGDETYLVSVSRGQTLRVSRLKGDRFVALPYSVPGTAQKATAFEGTILVLVMASWLTSHIILLGGAIWLANRWKVELHGFGHDVVILGSLHRRWLARCLDMALTFAPLVLVGIGGVYVADAQGIVEFQFDMIRHRTLSPLVDLLRLGQTEWGYAQRLVCLFLVVAWAAAVFMASTIAQGRWGITPGKWLCGLRVVRTTLRPCGLRSSLLREMLLCVDTLFLFSPLPGVVTILLTDARQRLGDLVGDTVVIDDRTQWPDPHSTCCGSTTPDRIVPRGSQ